MGYTGAPARTPRRVGSRNNQLRPEDRAVHDWYRFVLSFPPHLVRDYVERLEITPEQQVLDPFCGTGTTLVECRKQGIPSVGLESHPMACFASKVKLDWEVDAEALLRHANEVAAVTRERLRSEGLGDVSPGVLFDQVPSGPVQLRALPAATAKLLLKGSISPCPLHRTLVLMEVLEEHGDGCLAGPERLALADALVSEIGNLHFGPEVGVRGSKPDVPVVDIWLKRVRQMACDLEALRGGPRPPASVHRADARTPQAVLEPRSVDAVITSPPYPNEKDYTRTTRLESVLLGLIRDRDELRALKRGLVRSNTRGVYKADDDDLLVSGHAEISRIADAIEKRRVELGKTSGFERLYARVTKLYFGGMARHLSQLRPVLRKGAKLAYVVGDQASYLRVMIRTGKLLADIARSLGYEVTGLDLFRERLATATKQQLREEVLLLRWPG